MIINNVRGVTSALFLSELAARTQLSLSSSSSIIIIIIIITIFCRRCAHRYQKLSGQVPEVGVCGQKESPHWPVKRLRLVANVHKVCHRDSVQLAKQLGRLL